jgi:hypothetical protein
MAFGQLFLTTADAHVCYVTAGRFGVDGHRRVFAQKRFRNSRCERYPSTFTPRSTVCRVITFSRRGRADVAVGFRTMVRGFAGRPYNNNCVSIIRFIFRI